VIGVSSVARRHSIWYKPLPMRASESYSWPSMIHQSHLLILLARSYGFKCHCAYPWSFCRTISPLLPFCFPLLPPSTTSLSSWKNWLTTVCLCKFPLTPSDDSSHIACLCSDAGVVTCRRDHQPSSSVTLSSPSASSPAVSDHLSLSDVPEMRPSSAVWHIL
jgi:hypothetical protein